MLNRLASKAAKSGVQRRQLDNEVHKYESLKKPPSDGGEVGRMIRVKQVQEWKDASRDQRVSNSQNLGNQFSKKNMKKNYQYKGEISNVKPDNTLWVEMMNDEMKQEQMRQVREARAEQNMQAKHKKTLDAQVRQRNEQLKEMCAEEIQDGNAMMKLQQQYIRDQRAAKKEKQIQDNKETSERLRMERQLKREAKIAKDKRLADEKADIMRIKRELAKEEEARLAKIQQQKIENDKIIRANELRRAQDYERRVADARREIEMAQEYAAMLDRQEASRKEALAKSHVREARLLEVGKFAQESMADQARRDEERMKRHVAEADAAADRKAREAKNAQMRAKQEYITSLNHQVQQRTDELVETSKRGLQERNKLKQYELQKMESERAQEQAARAKQIAYKESLAKQMYADRIRKKKESSDKYMTTTEMQYNKMYV